LGVRTAQVGSETMTGNVILLGVCVLLLAYLVAALLWPEKF
jgi:K+-transporting ATPase KdpF subunit